MNAEDPIQVPSVQQQDPNPQPLTPNPRIGTAPISWGICELPGWGQELPVSRVLDEMAAAGYAGTELGPWGYLPDDVTLLQSELRRRGLSLVGGFCPVTLHVPARLEEQRQFASGVAARLRDLGAEVLVLAEAGDELRRDLAGRVNAETIPRFGEDDWKRFCAGAQEIAADARDVGLVTAFHPHVGTYVETEQETERLLDATDARVLGLCVDTGHLAYAGADPVALTARHRQRVRHVHLKDVDPGVLDTARRNRWSFADAVAGGIFVPLGAGTVNLSAMLPALRAENYSGWLVVEQDTRLLRPDQEAQPLAHAIRSRSTLRELCG